MSDSFVTPWTVAHQTPSSMEFSRQENWSRLPSTHGILWARILEWVAIPSPGDLPDPGIESVSCTAGGLFMAEPLEKP